MPAPPLCAAMRRRTWSAGFDLGMTRYARFARLKLPMQTKGSFSRSWVTMSFRTRSVAVAVRAMNGNGGKPFAQFDEAPILRPEVVAPFADAVGLVDGHPLHRPLGQRLHETRLEEALGRHVEEAILVAPQAAETLARVVGVEGGVEERGLDAVRLEGVDLVLHQGDEGRDDEGEALAEDGGELEAQRLPSPGGQQGEDIATGQSRGHDVFLIGPEARIAEGVLERLQSLRHRGHADFSWSGHANMRRPWKKHRNRHRSSILSASSTD